jgi:DNA polymerase elongation subunit (family B)
LRGSALRSRGTEPFLKRLTDQLIAFLLGASSESPIALVDEYRRQLRTRSVPIEELAKSETLSQNLDAYERFIADGGKPRRASAEAALRMSPRPSMGDRIVYYVAAGRTQGRANDWQRARPLAQFDPEKEPYDADYYMEKLNDWVQRYGSLLGITEAAQGVQGELQI